MVFPADVLGSKDARYFGDDAVDVALQALLEGVIGRAVVQLRLERAGLDAERVTSLTRRPRMQALVLDDEGAVEQDVEESFLVMTAFVGLLYLYGQALGRAVLTEKTGKTAEIMLSSLVVMFMRVLVGDPGTPQVAVGVAGMVLVTVAAVWAAAKVFRLGILLTGKKGTFGAVVRLLRA